MRDCQVLSRATKSPASALLKRIRWSSNASDSHLKFWIYDNQSASQPSSSWQPLQLALDHLPSVPGHGFIRLTACVTRVEWPFTIQMTHRLSAFAPHTAEMEIAWSNVATLPACAPAKASR